MYLDAARPSSKMDHDYDLCILFVIETTLDLARMIHDYVQ